jgi:hypothetical protein
MAQVLAILDAASTSFVDSTVTKTVTPSPAALSLKDEPVLETWVANVDLENSRMQYGYLIYQTYNAAGGAKGMAQASGTSDWVNITDVSTSFPNVRISATSSSSLLVGEVTFIINGITSYTQTTPGLYNVVVDET